MKRLILSLVIINACNARVHDARRYNNHAQAVTAIGFDKEGRSMITGSLDGSMCKRGLGQTYEGKTIDGLGPVTHLKRIGQFIAAVHAKCDCGDDKAKHRHPEFYNIADLSYESAGALRQGGHDAPIADMQIINGKSMVSVDQEAKLVFLYNCMRAVTMNEGMDIFRKAANINHLTVASPSRIIGIHGQDNVLYYFDPEMKEVMMKALPKEIEKITLLAALKHYLLAFSTEDKKIMLMNSKTGAEVIKNLGEHAAHVVDIQKINKRLFATVDKDGLVKVWNAKTGTMQFEVSSREASQATSLGIHWNKKKQEGKIAVGYQNGVTTVSRYDLEKPGLPRTGL